MTCSSCKRELPSGFPGATLTCSCGATTILPTLPSPSVDQARSGGPYRGTVAVGAAELETRCPYCGNGCPSLVRVCPHCDVRLENVRCARCYSLQAPGAFACLRCGHGLELEPLLDATDAPCPRCRTPLEAAAVGDQESPAVLDPRTHECPRCGGIFVPRDALAEILCRAELQGSFAQVPRATPRLSPVTYVPCPLCHVPMNRTNFGRASGVIVDVCRKHGTWFDGGELTQVVAFAASGGLARARVREEAEKRELEHKRVGVRVELSTALAREDATQRLDLWRDFLHDILWF